MDKDYQEVPELYRKRTNDPDAIRLLCEGKEAYIKWIDPVKAEDIEFGKFIEVSEEYKNAKYELVLFIPKDKNNFLTKIQLKEL